MVTRAIVIWVVGLITFVPYGIYYLLYYAGRDQYAILITLILFWIFGYWGLAGIIISAIKSRRVYNALTMIQSREKLEEIIHSHDAKDVAIDLISRENRIPKFIATKIYDVGLKKLSDIKDRSNGRF